MDVNGTKFHLLADDADWGMTFPVEEGVVGGETLGERWELTDEAAKPDLEWDPTSEQLRLARQAPIFRRAGMGTLLDINQRRGAARDQYGHWYWIDEDESGIRFLPNGETESVEFWSSTLPDDAPEPAAPGAFEVCLPDTPPSLLLRGLTVTNHHYLVVGNVTERGLLVFDLHRGGPPISLVWPEAMPFEPWDLAPTADGGVLVLDGANLTYWRLDEKFRFMATVDETPATFQPSAAKDAEDPPPPVIAERSILPEGYSLAALADLPVSIEEGPEGHALVLDIGVVGPEDRPPSRIVEVDGETQVAVYELSDILVGVPTDTDIEEVFSVRAHDFAYVACTDPDTCLDLSVSSADDDETLHLLYVALHDGNQVIAFQMQRDTLTLDTLPDYLPLRRWEAKGLVAVGERPYYDFADRWLPLQVLSDCRYARVATIVTPTDFSDGIPEQPFDSNEIGCVWHRLLLDAEIPSGTAIRVRARAADDAGLLESVAWLPQPGLYRRSDGAELPFYDPWVGRANVGDAAGTWELLLQGVAGRYIQLEITLEGTGRSTPEVAALRLWYPRFSYLEAYLPALYQEEAEPADYLERWLANFEGFYTHLEDSIEAVSKLLDARTAPADALDWLAGWMGLVLDPLWPEERRRFFIRHAHRLYRLRGTVPGLEIAIRIYLDDEVDASIFELAEPACQPIAGQVRIVEHFLTRDSGGLVYGDTSAVEDTGPKTPAETAHRFTVLIPTLLDATQEDMVQRIIELGKPAHTVFTLRRYYDAFRVGEARLGLDTQIGDSREFALLVLGDGARLPHVYLGSPYPLNIDDRIVLSRDRLGELPDL